jgi:hypothetical protein
MMRVVVLFGLVVGCTARYSGAKHDVGLMRSLGLNPNRPLPAEYTAVGEVSEYPVRVSVGECITLSVIE